MNCIGCGIGTPLGVAVCRACEPVPAPQPPADATPTVQASPETREWVARATAKWPVNPAGPPVTGDGDAAVVKELAMKWTLLMPVGLNDFIGMVREVLARGRALGAREERADIIRDAHESHCYCCPGQPRCPICEFADAIACCAGRGML